MGWRLVQPPTSWDIFQFECIGFVIWDLTDGILQLWIDLRLEMGLSKTTISRLHFSPCASNSWYYYIGILFCLCVVFLFYRCMNQAVYFCTGELQPALYAHYGLAMERRSAEWYDGRVGAFWKEHQWYCWWLKSCTSWQVVFPIIYRVSYIPGGAGFQPSTVVAVVTIWEPLFFLCLNFILMNIGRWS